MPEQASGEGTCREGWSRGPTCALEAARSPCRKFVVSARFSPSAVDRASDTNLQTTIVLIDGKELAELMIDHGVGVSDGDVLKILKLDEDYFSEDLGG